MSPSPCLLSPWLVPPTPLPLHQQRACPRIVSAQARGLSGDAARAACMRRCRSAGGERSLSVQRAQRCHLSSAPSCRLLRGLQRHAAAAAAPREEGQELGLRTSVLLLASFLAFTALPACASDGTVAAASEVATTLTGLAVAFFGGVAILMRPVQSDISTLKADVSGLKSDVSGLKSDVAGLKSDVADLKSDVGEIKVNLNVSMLLTIVGFVSLGALMVTTNH